MRKIFTSLFLVMFALFANAQYYIPNSGFENWKGSAGSTYQSSDGSLGGGNSALGLRQRPGDEPSDWEGSSINQKVSMEKKETLIEKSSHNGNAVKMTNKDVKVLGIGSTAPGFISFATPWVYAISKVNNCDGGVYGGRSFRGRPDAIRGYFNRSGNTGESAHIIVYTWKGTYKSNIKSSVSNDSKDNTDKAIMDKGGETVTQYGTRIASCDYSFATTNGWQEIEVPLNYNYDDAPEMVNVILSSGDYWTRGNIKNGSVLEADDVQFVYYSELASLKYDGVNYFSNGNTSYVIPAAYDESKLELSSNGKGAKIEKSFEATSNTLTITIKGDDFSVNNSNQHVYTIVFDDDAEIVVPEGPKPLGERLYSLADADENKTYVLYNEHFTTYAVYEEGHGDKVWVAGMRGDSGHTLSNAAYSTPVDVTSEYACWQVIKDGDKYQLYNVGGEMYLTTPQYEYDDNLKYCSFSSEPVSLSVVNLGGGKFAFNAYPSHTNANLGYMCAAPQLAAPLSVWSNDDAGAAWVLIENPNVTIGEVVDPELPEQPEIGVVGYTPTFTGVKTTSYTDRWIQTITLNSTEYSDESANTLSVNNSERLCYNDYSETVTMVGAVGEEVTLSVNIGNASWIHSYVYIDADEDGFTAGIAADGYTPTGDLMSYSFYNNGGTSDNSGKNSAGRTLTGDARSTVELPSFVMPEEPGVYRMRVKIDWCNIDPNGDQDGKFGDFMTNGGQIVDFMIEVVDPDASTDIDEVEEEMNPAFEGIYDLQGRKLDEITKTGIYIVNGKKVFIKK
ncbi:MAG: hypothetical protein IKA52_00920 [Bacteroidaceae bacterium]|nr:hypothetical protein [Bacteroidaceae bacterium]